MDKELLGIHHITAIAGEPQQNLNFYAGMLGLRLVKLTVNFDDPASYHLEQWNYLWSSRYGSDQYSIETPGQKGHDIVSISAITLSNDGRDVRLTIPHLRPVHQMELKFSLTAADGSTFKELAYLTINAVPAH